MHSPDEAKWQEAIDKELASMQTNKTWTVTDLPAGRKPIQCKWVFREDQ